MALILYVLQVARALVELAKAVTDLVAGCREGKERSRYEPKHLRR